MLVVVGQKEKSAVESILHECTPELREIYRQTEAGNGQKWLMIDVENRKNIYADIFRLLDIRRG